MHTHQLSTTTLPGPAAAFVAATAVVAAAGSSTAAGPTRAASTGLVSGGAVAAIHRATTAAAASASTVGTQMARAVPPQVGFSRQVGVSLVLAWLLWQSQPCTAAMPQRAYPEAHVLLSQVLSFASYCSLQHGQQLPCMSGDCCLLQLQIARVDNSTQHAIRGERQRGIAH
jgi:hypothetical protein